MILKSQLEGCSVEYKVGDRIGKVNDVIVDVTDAKWPIHGLAVSPGFGKGEVIVTPPNDVTLDDEEGNRLVIAHDAAISTKVVDVSNMKSLKLDFIDNLPVMSSDGERVGSVYDVTIATRVKPWKVKKLLVRSKILKGGLKRSERRLRLDVKHVKRVSITGIELGLSKAQVDKL